MINKSGLSVAVLIFVSTVFKSFAQNTPDPGVKGPFTVSTGSYNLGDLAFNAPSFPKDIEMRGSVHYPSSLNGGPFPVLVLMHGRHETCYKTSSPSVTTEDWPCISGYQSITSFEGYNYFATQMASHGYIVISISTNAINADDNSIADRGMAARAELMQHHLDLWKTYNTTGAAPFGTLFIGKLDMKNIGTMGHSRGGEGVVAHALLNKSLGSPYGIRAVLALAPVDFGRKILNGIPFMNIAPYCDGDVSDIQGVHFYDDARYSDPLDNAPKHSVLLMGANHNFFSTVWTPGSYIAGTSDDWDDNYGGNDPHCGTNSGTSKRLTPAKQQAAFNTYASAFFRVYIGNEMAFAPILEVDDIVPPVSSTLGTADVFVSYHAPKSMRLDVNREDSENAELTNTLGGAVSSSGLIKFDICADDAGEINCSVSSSPDKEPHSGYKSVLGMSQLGMSWDNPTDSYENIISANNKNFSIYKSLQFRAAIDFSEYTSVSDLDFTVQLIDATSNVSSKSISAYTHAMYHPPGSQSSELPKVMFNTIKIPISDFTGIDLTQVQKIKFLYNKSTQGSIYVVDLALSGTSNVTSAETVHTLPAIHIYPNPTSNVINIDFGKNDKSVYKFLLYNMFGELLYSSESISGNNQVIDLNNYSKGLYILSVLNGDSSQNYKITKN